MCAMLQAFTDRDADHIQGAFISVSVCAEMNLWLLLLYHVGV